MADQASLRRQSDGWRGYAKCGKLVEGAEREPLKCGKRPPVFFLLVPADGAFALPIDCFRRNGSRLADFIQAPPL
jgi:hypothetical protein